MRLTGVWMVSVDQDHAFPDQHLFQLGIRSGYLTMVSRVPCARVLCCVTRYEGGDNSTFDYFLSIDSREVFSGFWIDLYSTTWHICCKIYPQISSRMIINSIKIYSSRDEFCHVSGLWKDSFGSYSSIMNYMDVNLLRGVWMMCMDQDHTSPDQHLLQLGIRSGYLTFDYGK